MVESDKARGLMDVINDALGHLSHIISASIFPPIAEGAEMVMKTVEERILRIQKKLLRRLSSLVIIGFGGVLLIFSLFFLLREDFGWSNAAAFFAIGITVFVVGLLLKVGESDN